MEVVTLLKKTLLIEIKIETDVEDEILERVLQKYFEKHSILDRMTIPVLIATEKAMKVESVRTIVKKES